MDKRRTRIAVFFVLLATLLLPLNTRAEVVKWGVSPQSGTLQPFGQLYILKKNGKVGLVRRDGSVVAEVQYDSITPFKGGYSLLFTGSGRDRKIEGILNADYQLSHVAEEVSPTRYQWFSDGLMPVRGTGGWGYLSPSGTLSIPCQFERAFPFSNGVASVTIDKKSYYVTRYMDYLSVEAGYGNLVYASTFSEGEAVVYTTQLKGYVINRQGRKLRPFKQDINNLRSVENRADHTIGTPLRQPETTSMEPLDDQEYTIYSMDGLQGYKRGGQVVVPAQFDDASPVKGGYAVVRLGDKEGVIQLSDGELTLQNATPKMVVKQGKTGSALLRISLPQSLADQPLSLRIKSSSGEVLSVESTDNGTDRKFAFECGKKKPGSRDELLVEAVSQDLVLLAEQFNIDYVQDPKEIAEEQRKAAEEAERIAKETVIKKPITPETGATSKPEVILSKASFTIDAPRAGSKRANPRNEFFVNIPVSNGGETTGQATVTLSVNGKTVGSKTVKVGPKSRVEARIAVPEVLKERIVVAKATLQNGKSAEGKVTLVPLY